MLLAAAGSAFSFGCDTPTRNFGAGADGGTAQKRSPDLRQFGGYQGQMGAGGEPSFGTGIGYHGSSIASVNGAGAVGGSGPELLQASFVCGDGFRDVDLEPPNVEECDDGEGTERDLCDENCQVSDTAVVPLPEQFGSHSTKILTAGHYHACSILYDNQVKCWGYNAAGQLGLGDGVDRGTSPTQMGAFLPNVALGASRSAKTVTGGDWHTCAVLDDGSVKCWGRNDTGQLGLGDTMFRGAGPGEMGEALAPVALGASRRATALSLGTGFSCALLDTEQVKCWGINGVGQLGLGHVETRGDQPGEMGDELDIVPLGLNRSAKFVASGLGHSCAVLDDGSVKCWGYNVYGQLGQGDGASRGDDPGELGDELDPVYLGEGRTAAMVAVGEHHSCALLDDGNVKCWGSNLWGQVGTGVFDVYGEQPGDMLNLPPVDLGSGRTAIAISATYINTCVLLDNYQVKCWGDNQYGQLGQGDTILRGYASNQMGDALEPIVLGSGRTAKAVAVQKHSVCVVLDNDRVKCWGHNQFGQLGLGDTTHRGDDEGEMENLPVIDLGAETPQPSLGSRYLGEGRHAVAGGPHGFAVVFVDPGVNTSPINLSIFDLGGDPRWPIPVSDGGNPVLFANPVVAALPDGSFAVAWTDFNGDGDELGIALRRASSAVGDGTGDGIHPPQVGFDAGWFLSPIQTANSETLFSQYDADILAVGETLVVAWADNADPATAPDLRYRTFSTAGNSDRPLAATSADRILSASEDVEGNVALAPWGTSWAAAWRSGRFDGLETIDIFAADSGDRWSVSAGEGGHLPGATEDHPAIAELDADHLLVLFTEGTDPEDTSVANVGRLRAAVVDIDTPASWVVFDVDPQHPDYTNPAIAQSQPSLVRVNDEWYASWRSAARPGEASGEEIWLARINPVIGPESVELVFEPEIRIPRWPAGSHGDQRSATLGFVPPMLGGQALPGLAPEGGLLIAWDDYAQNLGPAQGKPDVLTAFYPAPVIRFPQRRACTVEQPCGPGLGDCDSNAECQPGLVCPAGSGNGVNFGLGPNDDACVLAHCANGIQDADELGADCGGTDCGACLCPDGVVLHVVGEQCDEGGNTASCDADCTHAWCGDGFPNTAAGEQCDDGNTSNTDACVGSCVNAVCGDGFVRAGVEQCDDSNTSNTDACVGPNCQNAVCGDGFVRAGVEQCDDSNTSNTDACVGPTCQNAICGDGFVRAGVEQCDDGNTSNTDACVGPNCQNAFCGDGFVRTGVEVCDPTDNPQCNATCTGLGGCTHAATCLSIESASGVFGLNPHIRIKNNSAQSYQLNELVVRYWFTRRDVWPGCVNPMPLFTFCSGSLTASCEATAHEVSPVLKLADSYVDVRLSGFNGPLFLLPGQSTDFNVNIVHTAPLQSGVIYPPPSPLNAANDYSQPVGPTYQPNTRIAIYRETELLWGTPPSAPQVCGDNVVDACEACDAGPSGDALCRPTCIPTSCPATGPCLRVQHKAGDPSLPDDPHIKPHLQIVNVGAVMAPLPPLKIRYWFTRDTALSGNPFASFCDAAGVGCALVTRNFFVPNLIKPGSDRYLEVGFTSSAPTLAPGASSGQIQVRFNKLDNTNFDENKDTASDTLFDYSWRAQSTFTDWANVGLYNDGVLIWGTAP